MEQVSKIAKENEPDVSIPVRQELMDEKLKLDQALQAAIQLVTGDIPPEAEEQGKRRTVTAKGSSGTATRDDDGYWSAEEAEVISDDSGEGHHRTPNRGRTARKITLTPRSMRDESTRDRKPNRTPLSQHHLPT